MTINEITEAWTPRNKAKHKSCQRSVKNRVSVWPSAYASAQVVQCYYGKKKKVKETTLSPHYLSVINENQYSAAETLTESKYSTMLVDINLTQYRQSYGA